MASSSQHNAPLTSAEIPVQIDLLISLQLHLWPALGIAIQNGWGTANPRLGEDKRDWLAGAISDLFAQKQLRDLEDLEDVLEQVMSEEFEVVVDDGTLEQVARNIWRGVDQVRKGDASEVQQLMSEWEEQKRKGSKALNIVRGQGADDEDISSSEDDDETEEEEWNGFRDPPASADARMDVDMDEAPSLVEVSKKKAEPEVDDDGFTKVVGKKRR